MSTFVDVPSPDLPDNATPEQRAAAYREWCAKLAEANPQHAAKIKRRCEADIANYVTPREHGDTKPIGSMMHTIKRTNHEQQTRTPKAVVDAPQH